MSEAPRYATLRDYLRVIRSQWLLILVIAFLFAGIGFGLSQLQEKKYTAEATLNFREIQQDLTLFGIGTPAELNPEQRAAVNSELVTRPEINLRVKRDLDTSLSPDVLAGMITTEVDPDSALVAVKATSSDPVFAADLANAYARAVQAFGDRQQARRIDRAIASLRRQAGENPVTPAQQAAQAQLTNLQTLRAVSDPVQIAERATVPAVASSPRPRRNTVLAGLVGIVFGLGVAFLRDSLDRRLRGPRDIHDELGLPILGSVSDAAMGFVKPNGHATLADADLEAFRMLRANLAFLSPKEQAQTVLVTSGLPEEGKSTVAMALAITSALAGRRTLLVECDLRRPSLAARLGCARSPGLTDFLDGRASPSDVLQLVDVGIPGLNGSQPSAAKPAAGQLVYISSGSAARQPAETLGSAEFRDFLEKVGKAYEVVVVDSSPLLPVVDTLQLAPQVDAILVCVRVSQTTRDEAKAARESLHHLPERPTGVVVTGVKPGDGSYYGGYYDSYGAAD